jgi:hypothetical protein
VDRVHSAWTGRHARVHVGPGSGMDKRHGGVDEGSPKLELWWRGGVTEAKNNSGLSSARGRRRARESLGKRGGGVVVAGGPLGFI